MLLYRRNHLNSRSISSRTTAGRQVELQYLLGSTLCATGYSEACICVHAALLMCYKRQKGSNRPRPGAHLVLEVLRLMEACFLEDVNHLGQVIKLAFLQQQQRLRRGVGEVPASQCAVEQAVSHHSCRP
jgi:hypothetical protein